MKITTPTPTAKELVINWHITEACNYSCTHCYAHWCKPQQRELIHQKDQVLSLLKMLHRYFSPENGSNDLAPYMQWSSLRINIAGGEPLL